jgi:hypothetical protein
MNYPLINVDPRRRPIDPDLPDPALLQAPLPVRPSVVPLPTQAPVMQAQNIQFDPTPIPRAPIGEGEQLIQQGIIPAAPSDNMTPRIAPGLPTNPPVAPGPYDQFSQLGNEAQKLARLQAAGPEKVKKGWLQRLKQVGLALLESGGNPIVGGMVAVNPQLRYDRQHRMNLADAGQQADTESQLRQRRMAELENMGQATGLIPGTQEPTEQRRQRMEAERQRQQTYGLNRDKFENVAEYRNKRMQDAAVKNRVAIFNRNPSALSETARQQLAEDLNMPELLAPVDYKQFDLKIDSAGNFQRINKATGKAEAITDEGGQAVGSFDATKQASLDKFRQQMVGIGAMNAQTGRMNAQTSIGSLNQRLDKQEADELKDATGFEDKASEYEQQAALMAGAKQADGKPYPPEAIAAATARAAHLREQAEKMRTRLKGRTGAARNSITRGQYDEAVKILGKAKADAEIKRRGVTIQD